jgi:hypothetical protein
LNRYTAVTLNTSVYDVLNTRTSDTNGTPPTPLTDAATGNVTNASARSGGERATSNRVAGRESAERQIRVGNLFVFIPVNTRL